MEFDKSRVYTALNAGELQIGSKCIFADTIDELKSKLEYFESYIDTLEVVYNDNEAERFCCRNTTYLLAYLIEPPAEPKYKPFESVEKAMEAIGKHGGWVKRIDLEDYYNVRSCRYVNCNLYIYADDIPYKPNVFLQNYVFADDGTPCGELVEG